MLEPQGTRTLTKKLGVLKSKLGDIKKDELLIIVVLVIRLATIAATSYNCPFVSNKIFSTSAAGYTSQAPWRSTWAMKW